MAEEQNASMGQSPALAPLLAAGTVASDYFSYSLTPEIVVQATFTRPSIFLHSIFYTGKLWRPGFCPIHTLLWICGP